MKRQWHGFTLIELLITLAVIGILAAIAYPAYQDQVRSARRSDGQIFLMDAMAREERIYTDYNTYTTTLFQDGDPDVPDLGYTETDGAALSPEGWYELSAAACGGGLNECVTLTATPQGVQADDSKCGALTYNSQGIKGIGATATGTVDSCW